MKLFNYYLKFNKIFAAVFFGIISSSDILKPQKLLSEYNSSFTGSDFTYSESNPTPTGFGDSVSRGFSNSYWYWEIDFNEGDEIKIGTTQSDFDTWIFIVDPNGSDVVRNDDQFGEIEAEFGLDNQSISCMGMDVLCSYGEYEVQDEGTHTILIGDLMGEADENDLGFLR